MSTERNVAMRLGSCALHVAGLSLLALYQSTSHAADGAFAARPVAEWLSVFAGAGALASSKQ